MSHAILFIGEREAASQSLLDYMCEAGVAVTLFSDAGQQQQEAAAAAPDAQKLLAVVLCVVKGMELAELHARVVRARGLWPETPLVACQSDPLSERRTHAQRLDNSTLKRLGFNLVADEPSQLPAVLRDLESHDRVIETSGGEFDELASEALAPASLLLPERLTTERLRASFEMVASLHFAADQKSAAHAALAGMATLVRADRWTLYMVSEAGAAGGETTFEPLAVRGLTESERALPESDWRRALRGDALAFSGAQSESARRAVLTAETMRKREGERRTIAVPLVSGERVMGVLEAVREGAEARLFTPAEASLLSALALPLAAALSNSSRIAEAERLSQTDDLTKLYNARFLRHYLLGELKRARRYGSPVSAMFLDLDDFKCINDRHGHLVGSHVLMEMAAVVLSSVRDTDVVARYGGDEFIVILPETGIEQALRVAERVRERIARHTFTGGRALRLRLTASFGLATFPFHAQSPHQLLACADTAMYEAKASRKNCVRLAAESRREA